MAQMFFPAGLDVLQLIHGENDAIVSPIEQEHLLDACGEPRMLWRIDRAGHR
ncbi:MAG: hypothetical protein JXB07_19150 [Anaerolineae bacterium]|nr:hypothetical protein [Anaerolineae bacterium]